MRTLAVVAVLVLSAPALADIKVGGGIFGLTVNQSTNRNGVVKCVYFQPTVVVDHGPASDPTMEMRGLGPSGSALTGSAAWASMPKFAWELPDGDYVGWVRAEALGAGGLYMSSTNAVAGDMGRYVNFAAKTDGLYFLNETTGAGNSAVDGGFFRATSLGAWDNNGSAVGGTNQSTQVWGRGDAFNAMVTDISSARFVTRWDLSVAGKASAYIDQNMWAEGEVAHSHGAVSEFKVFELDLFPGEDIFTPGGSFDDTGIIAAINDLDAHSDIRNTALLDKLTSLFGGGEGGLGSTGAPEFDSTTLPAYGDTLGEAAGAQLGASIGTAGGAGLPDLMSFGFAKPTLPSLAVPDGSPVWSITLPLSSMTAVFPGTHSIGDLTWNVDFSPYDSYRRVLRAAVLIFMTVWLMGLVWSELRKH